MLTPAGLDKSTGLITSLYQKDPTDPQWQDTQDYRDWSAWMDKYNPEADKSDQFNVYGYNAAMTSVHVLEQCGDNLTRENVMAQAANIQNLELLMLLPGVLIDTSADDFSDREHDAPRSSMAKWVLFGEVIDASKTM